MSPVLVWQVDEHTYAFVLDLLNPLDPLDPLGSLSTIYSWAVNPDLNFSWMDAAIVISLIFSIHVDGIHY